jgi:crotonobetainyl-CoA:carnitine CoA-transferase CaiB-like acyl-CoA transferase
MTRLGAQQSGRPDQGILDGIRVVELVDEQGEYPGLLLASLGADVVKVEPPGGSPTRRIGPFFEGQEGVERSLHFWQYNRAKRSVVLDLASSVDLGRLEGLVAGADVLLHSFTPGATGATVDVRALSLPHPKLVTAILTPFGETGPWAEFRGSDLVHLSLGGPVMNCGYDPRPDGTYDLPPIAPQAWHSYTIAGEQLIIGVLAALVHRERSGAGQVISLAVHEAVSKSTELDLMNWVMRRAPLHRQTCRHAAERVSTTPTIAHTKDGRWMVTNPMGARNAAQIRQFVNGFGLVSEEETTESEPAGGRAIPGSSAATEKDARLSDLIQRLVRKFTYDELPWEQAQEAGMVCAPLRLPHENLTDDHWITRETFAGVEHPEHHRTLSYAVRKWRSTAPDWVVGRRAPQLDEDGDGIRRQLDDGASQPVRVTKTPVVAVGGRTSSNGTEERQLSAHGRPFALDGVRIFDFSWFLASAGGTRFLAALGAEVIKVEWKANPDTRMAAMAPVGGRAARQQAAAPLPGVSDPDMGGQFNNKNAGKRGLSLNVRHPEGLAIARRLIAVSDVVAEGFSPGVMDRWGLGYKDLVRIRPEIIYAQQSGMGALGRYGRFRAVGPVAAALSGVSEMSGLPAPAMPAGWGYSYLDWIGAYSFAAAILAALLHRDRTGRGQWIDASQTESGIFITGGAVLEWSANREPYRRTGNRSPHKPAAPHGIYPCSGADRWITIACPSDAEWKALTTVVSEDWTAATKFATAQGRLAHQDELDRLLGDWTRQREPYGVMAALQEVGIPAGVCQTAEDRCDHDPQLRHLGWLTDVTGSKIGTWPVAEMAVKMDRTPPYAGGPVDRGAPCYGEDNEWILGELLGMSSQEIQRLHEDEII